MPGSQTAYLGLGSNVGDRAGNLCRAAAALEDILGGARFSPVYETEPLDYVEQPPFLNAVAAGTWNGTPEELLEAVHSLEAKEGRNRATEIKKGPRPLDIDILLLGEVVLDTAGLTIPHPRLTERAFALRPLLDLAPNVADPRTGTPLARILGRLSAQGIYLVSEHPYTQARGDT
jgi:2-amino-4-hydroxy-6-hydroxymethyldihydropteridine diphosphokinase